MMSHSPIGPLTALWTADEIRARIAELAVQIDRDLPSGTELHLVGVLKGGLVFLADLMRALRSPVTLDCLVVESYGPATESSGRVRVLKDLEHSIEGRDVLLVEDIVDTGQTLAKLHELLRARGARSLRTACLLSKPTRRQRPVPIDYVGFTIGDQFVVGYGLDLQDRFRQLPYLATVELRSKPPV